MREIISVDIKTQKADLTRCKTDVLVVGRFSDDKKRDKTVQALDEKLDGAIARLVKLGDFTGKPGFRHGCHSNEITAVARHAVDLGSGFKTRPLGCPVDRLGQNIHTRRRRGIDDSLAHGGVVRRIKLHMNHLVEVAIEKRMLATIGVIDKLMRNHDPSRPHAGADSANGIDRYDVVNAGIE